MSLFTLKKFFKYIPENIKSPIRIRHKKYVFNKALQAFKNHVDDIESHPKIIDDLIYGWGNEGWSAFRDYTLAIIKYARENQGSVLECGSGLSTIILGIIAEKKGFQVFTLEHIGKWANVVQMQLNSNNINSVTIAVNDLKDYGDYEWYDLNQNILNQKFELIICDGPPSRTKGGRFGMLPTMINSLGENAIILMDDYNRIEEKRIVADWKKMFQFEVEEKGQNDLHAIITMSKVYS